MPLSHPITQTAEIEGTPFRAVDYAHRLGKSVRRLPYALRVLAENVLRQDPQGDAVLHVADRQGGAVPFRPSRLLLQDMLGLALLVDVMAMRSAVADQGGDPARIDMALPVDLIIDHSMTINHWADDEALSNNQRREFELNRERFAFIKACEARFPNLRVFPPGGGIMHQINLEYLGRVVSETAPGSGLLAPDTNLGTDSHTPMINGLGVLGWGIGGLEAEAIMFGEATAVNVPRVVGVEVSGSLSHEATATDIALTLAEKLRAVGVVDCFVELFGPGYGRLSVADRGTIANMAPEYGATCVFCPSDANTVRYLRETGRAVEHVRLVEAYNRAQGLWVEATDPSIDYDQVVPLDLNKVGRSVAGPGRPEQRIDLADAARTLAHEGEHETRRRVPVSDTDHEIGDGDVVVASITSCTNTANPRNMVLAGLLARNAVARGLQVKPHVKTSLAPGSRVVARYLSESGLQASLDRLGFHVTAFACSTCNGMSGPLAPEHEAAINDHDVKGVAVLSGNRNFAGRIHPLASRNVLTAPPLVVAYALAGTILKDITTEPLGHDRSGDPVTLADLWPDEAEVDAIIDAHLTPDRFLSTYGRIGTVNEDWNALKAEAGEYDWVPSTYVSFPPFVKSISSRVVPVGPLTGLRPLAILGDSITTDHISPSGAIVPDSDAAKFLRAQGVDPVDFNSFGTRRGCSDIVIRSTFANVRLRNEMTPDHEGPWTRLEPEGKIVSMFEAIDTYVTRGQKLVVIGGKEYGCGSSRDTAAKAPWLAGVRAVITESFERIHRSNLVNMGIAPLCFVDGTNRHTLGLDGTETFDIGLSDDLTTASLTIHRSNGAVETVPLDLRLYNDAERETFRHGGLLPRAFRGFVAAAA
ncbi:MAG: aconitate hydratase AcnA [Pseudomonadota bacterium]